MTPKNTFASLILGPLCCLLVSGPHLSAQSPLGWTLVWADEFSQPEGASPDSTKWAFDIGASGWGNAELEYYTSRTNNARVESGKLVIEARKENYLGSQYTSARLKTQGKVSWTYGRIEARMQLPRGQGIWPAFWMLGTDISSVGWPACGEIDIMENIGKEPNLIHGTVHGPGYSGGNGIGASCPLPGGGAFADGFHVYAIEWTTNRIQWFLDGKQYFSLNPAKLPGAAAWVFHKPHFILLNLAVGGNWPGYPDETTQFPQRMVVDYVRVYAPAKLSSCTLNLLANPGFESPSLANWTPYGAGFNTLLESIQGVPVHDGTNVFKVFGQFNSSLNDSGAYQDVPVTPGQTLAASGWLLTPYGDAIAGGANSAWLEFTFRGPSGNTLALYRSAVMDSNANVGLWMHLGVTNQFAPGSLIPLGSVTNLVAPPGATLARFQTVFRQPPSNHGGAVLFDDLQLSSPPSAETSVPTAAGMADGSLRLAFPTYLDLPYTVRYAETLAAPTWSVLTNFVGDGKPIIVADATAATCRFYRVMRACP